MGKQYISEIRIFPYPNNVPQSWVKCDGQTFLIRDYPQLFNIIGTTYGGDGRTTFAVPNLKGRVPMHRGGNIILTKSGGEQTHRLTLQEIPSHTHQAVASSNSPDVNTPSGSFWASNTGFAPYSKTIDSLMSPDSLSIVGADLSHENMAPYLVFNICIAVVGELPTLNQQS